MVHLFNMLCWIEQNSPSLTVHTNNQIEILKLEVGFLGPFVLCTNKRICSDPYWLYWSLCGNVHGRYASVCDVLSKARTNLQSVSFKIGYGSAVADLDSIISDVHERIKLLKPEVLELYAHVSSSKNSILEDDIVVCFIESLLENLKYLLDSKEDLTVTVKKDFEALKEKLNFLRNFIKFMVKRCFEHEKFSPLLNRIEAVACTASSLPYLSLMDRTDENFTEGMNKLSDLLQTIQLLMQEAEEIYFGVLRASHSSGSNASIKDETVLGFANSLLETLKLLKAMPSWIDPILNEIEALREELGFLLTILDFPTQCSLQEKLNDLLTHLDAVSSEGIFVIFSHLKIEDENISEIRTKTFRDLLMKLKLIKAEVRETNKKEGETLYGSVNDPLKRLERIEGHNNELNVPMTNQLQTLKLELSFIRTFLNCTAKWCIKHGNWEEVLTNIESVVRNAGWDLCSLFFKGKYGNKSTESKSVVSRVLERIKLIKPDVRDVYIKIRVSQSFPSYTSSMRYELLLDLIQSLLDNLGDLLNCKANMTAAMKKLIKALEDKLGFLGNFLSFVSKQYSGHDRLTDLLKHVEAVADQVACFSYLFFVEEMDDHMAQEMNIKIYNLLRQIKKPELKETYDRFLKSLTPSQSHIYTMDELVMDHMDTLLVNLTELLNLNSLSVVAVKDQIETLQSELIILKSFYNEPPKQYSGLEKLNYLFTDIEALASEAGFLIYSLHVKKFEENIASEMKSALCDLLEKTKLAKAEMREIYIEVRFLSRTNFPRIELGFIDTFLWNLKELLSVTAVIACAKHQIESVKEELEFLRYFLNDVAEKCIEHEELKDLHTRVMDVAYEAEYVIDSLVTERDGPVWYFTFWLSDVIEEIKLMRAEVSVIIDKQTYGIKGLNVSRTDSRVSSQANSPTLDEVVVGFKDEAEMIIGRLSRESTELDIISIVGMPGLGKTTLARKVYNDPFIAYHFYIRAWCCVSQEYQKKELLLVILSSVIELTDRIKKMGEEDLATELRKSLIGKRYLIVLDDIWNIEAWNDLKRSFPDDHKGSRIVFTSRYEKVGLQAKPQSIPHKLRFLSEEESWNLLNAKVFQKESCPLHLVEIGKQIVEKCRRLPLAVVVVSGLLSKTEKSEEWWMQVAESLTSHIAGDPKQWMDILELSYKHLPAHLKQCFLYCGAFTEDKEIPVRKLIWLWTAERLITETEKKCLEDVADMCLMDLIDRSLLLVAKRSSKGGVKACRIHDLLRDFCLRKAMEENFLQLIYRSPPSSPTTYEQRRLCICFDWQYFVNANPSGPHTRSLLVLQQRSSHYDDSSFTFKHFKFLRVLDLECVTIDDSFPDGIEQLIYLRYLAFRTTNNSIPSSIGKLWNLEILVVKGLRGEVAIPYTFWNLQELRHLVINDRACLDLERYGQAFDGNFPQLENLQTLSRPSLFYSKKIEKVMRLLPNLQKLNCIFLESWDVYRKCNMFPVLEFLSHLESLKVFYYGQVRHPCKFSLPSNLKKLTLAKFRLPWSEMSTIGRLPNLEVLKLLSNAFEGQQWKTDNEFLKLKFLKFDSLAIAEWEATSDQFPNLQQLVLQRCRKLKEIPSSFGDVPTFQSIEVNWCSSSAANSALEIQEYQKDMGNEEFKTIIYPRVGA